MSSFPSLEVEQYPASSKRSPCLLCFAKTEPGQVNGSVVWAFFYIEKQNVFFLQLMLSLGIEFLLEEVDSVDSQDVGSCSQGTASSSAGLHTWQPQP